MTPKCLECNSPMEDQIHRATRMPIEWNCPNKDCGFCYTKEQVDYVTYLVDRYPDLVERVKERWLGEIQAKVTMKVTGVTA